MEGNAATGRIFYGYSSNQSEDILNDELSEDVLQDAIVGTPQQDTVNEILQQKAVSNQKYPWATAGSGAFVDKNGNYYEFTQKSISSEVEQVLDSQEKLREILSANYKVDSTDQVIVLSANDFELKGDMPAGGIEMTVMVTLDATLKGGDPIYVLHQKHDGKWEILPSMVDKNGMLDSEAGVSVHLNSLSPIVIVKVMSGGAIKALEKKSAQPAGNNEKKSPKTGDFF